MMSGTHRSIRAVAVLGGLLSIGAAAEAPRPSAAAARAAPDAARVAAAPSPEISETLSIRVELLRKRLYVTTSGGQVDTFHVSVGSEGYPTPDGEFTIRRVEWNPSWTPPESVWARSRSAAGPGDPDNPMGSVKMLFSHPDYYIHGTYEPNTVGPVTTHGCVRLRDEEAIGLARLVMEHGGVERPKKWFDQVLEGRSTRTVRLERAIRVVVVQGEPVPILGEPVDELVAGGGGDPGQAPRP